MKRAAVEFDAVDREGERREDVDVGCVGSKQAGGHAEARTALEAHLAEQRAGQGVGDVVHSASRGSNLVRFLFDLPGLALGDQRLEVGRLALGGGRVLLDDRAFEVRRGSS